MLSKILTNRYIVRLHHPLFRNSSISILILGKATLELSGKFPRQTKLYKSVYLVAYLSKSEPSMEGSRRLRSLGRISPTSQNQRSTAAEEAGTLNKIVVERRRSKKFSSSIIPSAVLHKCKGGRFSIISSSSDI